MPQSVQYCTDCAVLPALRFTLLGTVDEKGACGISLSPIARAENRSRIYVSFADVASLDGDVQ